MKQYTLSELCEYIQGVLSLSLPDSYWVRAEIASMSSKGGHGYFDLVEKTIGSQLPTAKMRATCWANIYPMLLAYFEQETGSRLQVGMQVLVEVEVHFHAAYGLSLNILNIDPSYTIGDLARQRQQTIRQLTEEGVMDLQRQLQLPTLVKRVAVVSAETAAGWGDFKDQLEQAGYRISATLFAATMQGENAERSILQALRAIAEVQEEFDAVAIIRGGGATTDLGCFDSYLLAATCAQFPLPVLTGIGHTRDVSIVDMVAHAALKTPTAVAAFLLDRMSTQLESIATLRRRLAQTAERQRLIRRHRLEILQQRIAACNPERIYRQGYSLAMANGKILRSIADAPAGTVITTHLADGQVESTVS